VTEIDWHKVYTARLAACCQRAAADLNLSVTTPFVIREETGDEHSFVALFPHLGQHNGTVVCLASDWPKLSEVAPLHGYTCVGVLPESCTSYDPVRWASFIREWDTAKSAIS
jgi:hypothetical protein